VFHHYAGSFAGSLSWIKQGRSKVSYNVIAEEDGTRHNVVPVDRVAWHAGKSTFQGRSGCNSFMVGFAFSGSTYDRALTANELASAVEFVRTYGPRYGWTLDTMTDHRQVSPGRKNNLNPVEWERLKERLRDAF
jgi:AmpD protein